MHRRILYEDVNVGKIVREPLSQVQLTASCREVGEMAGRLDSQVAGLGGDFFEDVRPSNARVCGLIQLNLKDRACLGDPAIVPVLQWLPYSSIPNKCYLLSLG